MREALFRIHRRFRFYSDAVTVASRTYFFLSCQKKVCKKEAQGTRNSAYAQKNESFRFTCCRSSFRSPNALRATEESGLYSARHIVLVVPLALVEYLTYGSRDRRRVFRLPRQSAVYASLSRFY